MLAGVLVPSSGSPLLSEASASLPSADGEETSVDAPRREERTGLGDTLSVSFWHISERKRAPARWIYDNGLYSAKDIKASRKGGIHRWKISYFSPHALSVTPYESAHSIISHSRHVVHLRGSTVSSPKFCESCMESSSIDSTERRAIIRCDTVED